MEEIAAYRETQGTMLLQNHLP